MLDTMEETDGPEKPQPLFTGVAIAIIPSDEIEDAAQVGAMGS